ncbi:hypothetical protein [Yoonia sp. SS1-5]|uniref:Uncharacterized protein n=1 Tax=Yoonia rhodophyticola TaxID=3137370 RepID=A0AAN0NLX8_9RHOB
MGRRYLTSNEVEAALGRGKTIECFIGPFSSSGRTGVRHLALKATGKRIELKVFETADLGSPDFLDLGEFGSVNPDVEFGDADVVMKFDDLAACFSYLEERWHGCTQALVNEGIVQDEYADYLARDC